MAYNYEDQGTKSPWEGYGIPLDGKKKHAPKPVQTTHMCERNEKGEMWPDQKMSTLERKFLNSWLACNGPDLERETAFDMEAFIENKDDKARMGRMWRSDFTHRPSRTLIEVEGGAWSGGRHTRGQGFTEDAMKYLRAWELGWTVLRLSGEQCGVPCVSRIVAKLRGLAEKGEPAPEWLQSLPPPERPN